MSRARAQHDLDAAAIVVHTSGTSGAAEAGRADLRQLAVERARLGVALGLDPEERWLCALPLSHVGGLSILLRSAIYATTAIVHERFDDRRASCDELTAARAARRSSRSCRRRSSACSTRPARPAARCAGRCSAARRSRRRCSGRAAAHGVPVAPTYGLTEACSQVTTLGAPLFCTGVRARRRRRDPRLRPDRRPGARGRCCTPATSARGTPTARCTSSGARPTRSSPAARTSRPAEVEAVLEGHPAVAEAAVHGAPHPRVGRGGRGDRRRRAPTSPRTSCAPTAPTGWRRSRCPRRSASPTRCRARGRASSLRR